MTRRELREHTFRLLFLKEFYNDEELQEQVQLYLEDFEDIPDDRKGELRARAERIYLCVPQMDEQINQVAKGWKTHRMGKVDLTIIRLALYEMLYDDEVPEKVAINEAVELAKKYGDDNAKVFVNGILASIVKEENLNLIKTLKDTLYLKENRNLLLKLRYYNQFEDLLDMQLEKA